MDPKDDSDKFSHAMFFKSPQKVWQGRVPGGPGFCVGRIEHSSVFMPIREVPGPGSPVTGSEGSCTSEAGSLSGSIPKTDGP